MKVKNGRSFLTLIQYPRVNWERGIAEISKTEKELFDEGK